MKVIINLGILSIPRTSYKFGLYEDGEPFGSIYDEDNCPKEYKKTFKLLGKLFKAGIKPNIGECVSCKGFDLEIVSIDYRIEEDIVCTITIESLNETIE